jgi:putative aldouronate transport system permease protein
MPRSPDRPSLFYVLGKILFLLAVVLAILLPFLHMLAVTFSSDIFITKNQVSLIPKGFTLVTYGYVLGEKRIYTAYYNTLVLVGLGTAVSLGVTATGGYALSRKQLPLRRFFSILIVLPLFFKGGLIPTFLTVKQYGLLNTVWAIILPYTVNIWNLLIMRTGFSGIPAELQESAQMDGLHSIGIFFRIILPLSKAVLAAIGLFYAVAYWNTYFAPLIYLRDPGKFPLQLILREMLLEEESFSGGAAISAGSAITSLSLKYATIIVSIVPVAVAYVFLQKYFVKGVMIGSIKG